MAEDIRERILERLVAIAKTVVAPEFVFRNQIDIPEKSRPAIVVFDSDEEIDDRTFGRGRPAQAPVIVFMSPEIYLLLEASPKAVGPALNDLRRRFLKAVTGDETLVGMLHNGEIRYHGFATGLAVGRSMEGESAIHLGLPYVLRPARL